MNKQEYIQSLKGLADFLEERALPDEWVSNTWSEVLTSYSVPFLEFQVINKQSFGEIAAALGTYDKSANDYRVEAKATLIGGAQVLVTIAHEKICEKVVIGKKTIPFSQAYMVQAVPEHEEDIIEWKCPDSFVALKQEEK